MSKNPLSAKPQRAAEKSSAAAKDRSAAILKLTIDKYLGSRDFNGLPIQVLRPTATLTDDVLTLIRERGLDLVRGDGHPNPHIKARPAEDATLQLKKIAEQGLGIGCLYPTPEVLARVVKREEYDGRPFTLELAHGAPQLDFRAFDLRSLEYYRNDPRFEYRVDDIHGSIIYKDEYFDKDAPAQDRLVMDRFGFCYSENLRRAVAVFLWDLHKLDNEQQQHWKRYLLKGDYKLHPDYYRTSILGDFPEGISIFDAFLEEKNQINIMSRLMGRAPLFRSEHEACDRPDGFEFLIRPTQKEIRGFTLLLDQLMSDDLNREFFHDVEMVEKGTSADGRVLPVAKGTIRALEEWLNKKIRFPDPKPKDDMLKTFRHIRKLRQKPAHQHEKDTFDEKYFEAQRELIIDAYGAMRTMRLILQNHPAARSHEVPEWLQEAVFWTH